MSYDTGKLCAIEKHRLLTAEVTEHYAYQLRDRILAEPITAIITIPFAFVSRTDPLVDLLVKLSAGGNDG